VSREGRRLTYWKIAATVASFAVWGFFLSRAFGAFGPSSAINSVTFNSDSAIPVLMSNDERPLTIFNLYYYGADRWGAWPFLATRLARHVTGYRWTDEGVFRLQAVWIFAGVLVFAALSRGECLVAAAVYLIALCLHRDSRYLIFELSQLYAWQATAILLSWYAVRRLFDDYLPAPPMGTFRRLVWLAPAFVFSFLAIWSSVASTIFIAFLVTLEALRTWLRNRDRSGRALIGAYALAWFALAAAALTELAQKMSYRRYSLRHYGETYGTNFGWDTGHLMANCARQLDHLARLSWWPLYALPAITLLAVAGVAFWAFLRSKDRVLRSVRTILAEDTSVLVLGAYGLAALNFALAVVVDHVRLNRYDDRYLTLTNLFGPVSGMLVVVLLLRMAVGPRLRRYAHSAVLLAALTLLAMRFPSPAYSFQYQLVKQTALDLAARAPGGVLMGSYWDTYVFAALQPTNTMTPLPVEGQVNRMPWARRMVRRADRVVVALRRPSAGAPVSPPPRLRQYGNTLRLIDPYWYDNRGWSFALYANDSRSRARVR
jgi:hypothetical protein